MKAAGVTLACGLVFATVLSVAFFYAYQPMIDSPTPRKELLVYATVSTTKPVGEIARVIEQQENCRIIVTKGGTGNLLRAIEVNQVGDLFLPGSDSYIKSAMEKELVTEEVFVGHNQAVMMVRKGNPKKITNDLANLADPQYYVVIGDPGSGAIGRATKEILEKRGIFEQVSQNARQWTTDSKELIKVLKDKEADLVVNWRATATWPENAPYVDVLPIGDEYVPRKRLALGLLKYSRHPDVARKFMEYAASEKGQALFRRYGL
ncbi:MAG: molybdate ABC transporter substrate-binding protein [Pirellulales bacterium]|nr:molybdate ABC transporter substrate-binding protein [Pirellulales bacterium]